ncbi:unnamed protein product [Brassica oleracea]
MDQVRIECSLIPLNLYNLQSTLSRLFGVIKDGVNGTQRVIVFTKKKKIPKILLVFIPDGGVHALHRSTTETFKSPSTELSRGSKSPDTNEPTPQTLTAAKRLKSPTAQGPNHHVLPSTKALRDETRPDGEEALGTAIPYEPSAIGEDKFPPRGLTCGFVTASPSSSNREQPPRLRRATRAKSFPRGPSYIRSNRNARGREKYHHLSPEKTILSRCSVSGRGRSPRTPARHRTPDSRSFLHPR